MFGVVKSTIISNRYNFVSTLNGGEGEAENLSVLKILSPIGCDFVHTIEVLIYGAKDVWVNQSPYVENYENKYARMGI